jgi:hypothetical protein
MTHLVTIQLQHKAQGLETSKKMLLFVEGQTDFDFNQTSKL